MKTWFLIFLTFAGSVYLFADVSLVAAQSSGETQKEALEKAPTQFRVAQAEQPKPERPIKQLLPGAGSIIKQHLPPPPPPPDAWYKNSTVIVAVISAVSAIAVAL